MTNNSIKCKNLFKNPMSGGGRLAGRRAGAPMPTTKEQPYLLIAKMYEYDTSTSAQHWLGAHCTESREVGADEWRRQTRRSESRGADANNCSS
jgi:hypothetical protein